MTGSRRRLRPLLVANFDFVMGGGEVGLLMLAEGLRQRGHRPRIAVPGPGPLASDFDRVVFDPRSPEVGDELASLAADADLVHVYSTATMVTLHRSGMTTPIVLHVLVPNPHPADAQMANAARAVICNSNATVERFPGAENVQVIYNGVAEPTARSESLGLDPTRRTIAIVGGTVLRKGQLDALPALLDVVAATDDVDVVFVGRSGGAEAMRLRRHARSSMGRMRLLGYVAHVADHLGDFALVLVPSRSEGFGRVAVEALRAGTPVLARRVEGLLEALAGLDDPWLPEDPASWADRIRRELDHPSWSPDELRAAAQRFGPERFVDEVERLYLRVIERQSGSP